MKRGEQNGGFTRIELIVVVLCVIALSLWLYGLATANDRTYYSRTRCVNNLNQISMGFMVWAGDHDDRFPWDVSTNKGGLSEVFANPNQGSNYWRIYQTMANELGKSPRILICPTDERVPATNFIVKGATNDTGNADLKKNASISYFACLNGMTDTHPQSFMMGDRNLGPGLTPKDDYGYSLSNNLGNDIVLATNSLVCWSKKMHSKNQRYECGEVMLGDGSIREISSFDFRSQIQPFAGVRCVPSATNAASSSVPAPTFRLIFP